MTTTGVLSIMASAIPVMVFVAPGPLVTRHTEIILHLLRNEQGEEVEVSEGLEAFLDAVNIYDLESRTDDRTDFSVAFWSADAPLTGFAVRCRLSRMNPLLDGGRTANLKLEQSGVKFASLLILFSFLSE